MNILQRTFFQMIQACIAYLLKHEFTWKKLAVLSAEFDLLEAIVKDVLQFEQIRKSNATSAEIAQREQATESLVRNYFRLSRKLAFYAQSVNNVGLQKQTTITENKLKNKSVDDLITVCQNLLTYAKENLANAGEYQISEEELKNMESELTTYKNHPITIFNSGNESRMATRQIKEKLDEARSILLKLDMGLEGMITDDTFLAGWYDARKIKNRHTTKKKEKEETTTGSIATLSSN